MIRNLARVAIWQMQLPKWDYATDQALRALGYNTADRGVLHASAVKVFGTRSRDGGHVGEAVTMLAAAGTAPEDMTQNLRAVRMLRAIAVRELNWATSIIAKTLATGRLDHFTYREIETNAAHALGTITEADVRAGLVTPERLIDELARGITKETR